MVNWKSKKLGDLLLLGNGLMLVILLNLLASEHFYRFDFTSEKRYTIKPQTKQILRELDDDVFVDVYLEGELNPGFTRLRRAIRETLEEFRAFSGNRVRYRFINPELAQGQKARGEFMADLSARGIQPTNVIDTRNGQRVEKLIFPGAIISYGGEETGVMLLKGNKASSAEEEINQSIEGLEFEMISALHRLANINPRSVGVVTGHGELDSLNAAGLLEALSEVYNVSRVEPVAGKMRALDAILVAKPVKPFSDEEKYAIDQFIMHGGKAVFLIDRIEASMDSAARAGYLALPFELGLDDMLFKYGVRINPDLLQDNNAAFFPVVTGQAGARPRMQLIEWPFFPLINRYSDHPITRNLDATLTRFVSSIDTVKAVGVRKTPLMFSSPYVRTVTAPVHININDFRSGANLPAQDTSIPVGYLLEGTFSSVFRNRFPPAGVSHDDFLETSVPTAIVVIADGDIARNEINTRNGKPFALGFDPYTNYTYANRDLLLNIFSFLTDPEGLIVARNKEVRIRPLDKTRIREERTKWQIINIVLPLIALSLYGVGAAFVRKKRFASFA